MSKPELRKAIEHFLAMARDNYGAHFRGLYQIIGLEYGDAEDQADIDLVVVLAPGDWQQITERRRLASLAFDVMHDEGVLIRARPVSENAWNNPVSGIEGAEIAERKARARAITVPA